MPYTSPTLTTAVHPDDAGATLYVVDITGKTVSFTRNDVNATDYKITVDNPGTYRVVVVTPQLERRAMTSFTIQPPASTGGGTDPSVGPAVWVNAQDPPPDPEAFPFWVRIS